MLLFSGFNWLRITPKPAADEANGPVVAAATKPRWFSVKAAKNSLSPSIFHSRPTCGRNRSSDWISPSASGPGTGLMALALNDTLWPLKPQLIDTSLPTSNVSCTLNWKMWVR